MPKRETLDTCMIPHTNLIALIVKMKIHPDDFLIVKCIVR